MVCISTDILTKAFDTTDETCSMPTVVSIPFIIHSELFEPKTRRPPINMKMQYQPYWLTDHARPDLVGERFAFLLGSSTSPSMILLGVWG